jgi:sulfur transfer protein SufE
MQDFQNMFAELFELESNTEKYEWIMDYSDQRISLSEQYHTGEYLVRGCTSPLWLAKIDGQYSIYGSSLIVNGLAGMIVDWYNQATAEQRQRLSLDMLSDIGLAPLISMGRQNGIANLIARLKSYEQ